MTRISACKLMYAIYGRDALGFIRRTLSFSELLEFIIEIGNEKDNR